MDYRLIAQVLQNQANRQKPQSREQLHEAWKQRLELNRQRARERSRRIRAETHSTPTGT